MPEKVRTEDPSIPRCLPLPGVENQVYGWSPPCFGLVVASDHFFQEPSSQLVRHGLGDVSIFHQKKSERTVYDWSVLDSMWSVDPSSDDQSWEAVFQEAMMSPLGFEDGEDGLEEEGGQSVSTAVVGGKV